MKYYLGVDIGGTSVKIAVVSSEGEIINSSPLLIATIVAPVFCQNLVSAAVLPIHLQWDSTVNCIGTKGFITSSLSE